MLAISTLCPIDTLSAQVSINADGTDPDPSAIMDLMSNNMGFLVPRMEQSERLAISSPAGGLLLYDNGPDNGGMYYNAGAPDLPNWTRLNTIIQETADICDRRIPIDSAENNNGTFSINQPGSYYFTRNISIDQSNGNNLDGITIDADDVTLDLNGFTLEGDFSTSNRTDDGIFILGDQDNIVIKNGVIRNWGGDGVNALNCDNCTFVDLLVEGNDGDGILADFGAIIYQCVARGNAVDGLEGDDNTIIYDCEASNNGDNGIETSEGGRVINCTATGNASDGIDVAPGSRVEGCVAAENGIYGIDLALGGQVLNCTANLNGRNGIDIASSCLARFNTANNNGTCVAAGTCSLSQLDDGKAGSGIYTFSNAQVMDNVCRNNFYGIRVSSLDTFVADNIVTGNSHAGLTLSSTGSFAIRNRAHNNGFTPIPTSEDVPGNFSFTTDNSFGPIIDVSSVAGNLLTIPGINNVYANFIY
ncbi:MAG: right-handed parallel beta-helix repeat-containing protein [Bacteroidota bacterium]